MLASYEAEEDGRIIGAGQLDLEMLCVEREDVLRSGNWTATRHHGTLNHFPDACRAACAAIWIENGVGHQSPIQISLNPTPPRADTIYVLALPRLSSSSVRGAAIGGPSFRCGARTCRWR